MCIQASRTHTNPHTHTQNVTFRPSLHTQNTPRCLELIDACATQPDIVFADLQQTTQTLSQRGNSVISPPKRPKRQEITSQDDLPCLSNEIAACGSQSHSSSAPNILSKSVDLTAACTAAQRHAGCRHSIYIICNARVTMLRQINRSKA